MLDILNASLAAAHATIRRLVLAGEPTTDARAEANDLVRQVEIEQRRQADEVAAAERGRADAIATTGRKLADDVLAGLNARLAAYDIDA